MVAPIEDEGVASDRDKAGDRREARREGTKTMLGRGDT